MVVFSGNLYLRIVSLDILYLGATCPLIPHVLKIFRNSARPVSIWRHKLPLCSHTPELHKSSDTATPSPCSFHYSSNEYEVENLPSNLQYRNARSGNEVNCVKHLEHKE